MSKYLIIQNEREKNELENPAIEFPYKLDTFQHNAALSIENGNENVLVVAHTSAGKSTVAEYAIAKAFQLNKKIIYCSPIKTLSNQKFRDFKNKFGDNIGIMTGDIKLNPDAQCLIMTTEILRNKLYKNSQFLEDVLYVVYDEIHYFNDPDRGHVWEESIVMLPKRINLIMLSASISCAEEFASWFGSIKEKPIKLISTTFRPVPLQHYVYDTYNSELLTIMDHTKNFNYKNYDLAINNFNERKKTKKSFKSIFDPFVNYLSLESLLPGLFFTFSRDKCTEYAKLIRSSLIDHEERAQIEKIFDLNVHRLLNKPEEIEQVQLIKSLLMKGVCVHHSGLIPLLKEIIEEIFCKGLIKVLFATETFAVGVNMPTRTVVFTGLTKFSGEVNDFRCLRSDEYTQMSGRAGRRGLDKKGTVIYLPLKDILEKHEMVAMTTGIQPKMISKFKLDTKFALKAIHSNIQTINSLVDQSLLGNENLKIIKSTEKDITILEGETKDIENIFNNSFSDDLNTVKEYCELLIKIKNSKNKERKKIQKQLDIINNNKSKDFDKAVESFKNLQIKITQLENLKYEKIHLPEAFNNEIINAVKFLNKLEFLTLPDEGFNSTTISQLTKENLSLKGILATEINECNEILMSYVINNNILEDLTPIEIVPILSLFIDDKKNDNIFIPENLPENIQFLIKDLIKIDEEFDILASQYYTPYNSSLNTGFTEIAFEWSNGKSLKEITNKYEIYEGNFIRNMQKINNICNELIEIYNILNNHIMVKKLLEIEKLLIKDIVTFVSLYIT